MRGLVAVSAIALALGLAGCGPQAATAEAEAKPSAITTIDRETGSTGEAKTTAAAQAPLVDGKPMWSANRSQSAEENAKEAFDRNGEAFGVKSVDAFVQKAHDFTSNPPAGVETLKRANGDTLLYDPKANIFAVVTKDGAPRTMFKPDDGAAYWAKQKTQVASQGKSKAKSKEG